MKYPPEAYAPDGTLWWEFVIAPGCTEEVHDRYRQLAPGDQEVARVAIMRLAGLSEQ